MTEFMNCPFTFWFLTTGFWVGVLTLLVLASRKFIALRFGARAAYLLWLLPVLRFVLPPLAILPAAQMPDQPVTAPTIEAAQPFIPFPDLRIETEPDRAFVPVSDETATRLQTVNFPVFLPFLWLGLGGLWLAAMLARQAEAQWRFREASVRCHDPALRTMRDELTAALGLRQPVRLRIIKADDPANRLGPFITGLTQPEIYLPHDFTSVYSYNEQRLTLLHELMHVKRGDLWAGFGFLTFRALNWPNPLVHLSSGAFRADQEAACDASVLEFIRKQIAEQGPDNPSATDYAGTIVKSARQAAEPSAPLNRRMAPTIANMQARHPIKERLMLMNHMIKNPPSKRAGLMAALLVATGLSLTATYTEARQDEELPVSPKAGEAERSSDNARRERDAEKQTNQIRDLEKIIEETMEENFDMAGASLAENELEAETLSALSEALREEHRNQFHFYTDDDHETVAHVGNSEQTVMTFTGKDSVSIVREGDVLKVNGKEIDLDRCRDDKDGASLMLNLKESEKGETVEVICSRTTRDAMRLSERQIDTKRDALRRSIEAMERSLETMRESERRAMEARRRAEAEQRRKIRALRRELNALDTDIPEPPQPPDPGTAAEPAPAPQPLVPPKRL